MKARGLTNGLRPFDEIDRLIRGEGYASAAAVERTTRYHQALAGDAPLSHRVASTLLAQPGAHAALFTGFVVPEFFPTGENDGPLGTLALARALHRTGFSAAIHVDRELVDTVRWIGAEIDCDVPILPIDEVSDAPRCDLAIAIEKPGANPAGLLHTYDGRRIESGSPPIDAFFETYRERRVPTLAIADLGNEIGFGVLYDVARSILPEGGGCRCGCGEGIVSSTSTDVLLPTAVSNWGAYGVAAAVALLTGTPEAALKPEEEARMLHVAAVRGCRDGVRRSGAFAVDGVSGELSVRLVETFWRLVRRGA